MCGHDVGTPDAARLHNACKVSPRVAMHTHKDGAQLVGRLIGERIHRGEAIELYAIDRRLVVAIVAQLDPRMAFALTVADGELELSIGTETLPGTVVRHSLA